MSYLYPVRKIVLIGRLPTFGFVSRKIKAAQVRPYGRGASPASRPSTQHTYGTHYIRCIVKNEPSACSQNFESVWSVWLSLAVDINKLQSRSSVCMCVCVCWEIRNSTASQRKEQMLRLKCWWDFNTTGLCNYHIQQSHTDNVDLLLLLQKKIIERNAFCCIFSLNVG